MDAVTTNIPVTKTKETKVIEPKSKEQKDQTNKNRRKIPKTIQFSE